MTKRKSNKNPRECSCEKRELIGTVSINYSKIDIVESENDGVRTDFQKDGSTFTYINLKEDLPIVIADVIHELMEVKLLKSGCRYHRTDLPENFEPITCMFVMSHDEFQIACHEIGLALANIMPKIIMKNSKIQNPIVNKTK